MRPAETMLQALGNFTVTTYNADGTATTPTITAALDAPLGIAVH